MSAKDLALLDWQKIYLELGRRDFDRQVNAQMLRVQDREIVRQVYRNHDRSMTVETVLEVACHAARESEGAIREKLAEKLANRFFNSEDK